MRAAIDAAGRLVVPKDLRDELGFTVPSRVRLENGPHGIRFAIDSLSSERIRELIERDRR